MKRLLLSLLGIALCLPLFAQYDFETEDTRQMVVSTLSPKFHNYYLSLQRAPKPDSGYVFFLYTQTPKDLKRFRFHLGTGVEESLQTIEHLREFLKQPANTAETVPNYNSETEIRVVSSVRQGHILKFWNREQDGFVYVTAQTLSILEDALRHWDDAAESAFAKKSLSDSKAINDEITKYKKRLAFKHSKPSTADYSPSYRKLFRQRINEYKKDLRNQN